MKHDNHLAKLSATANQQKEQLAALNAKTEQHLSALIAKIDYQQEDLNTLTVKTEQQIAEQRQEIPQKVQ